MFALSFLLYINKLNATEDMTEGLARSTVEDSFHEISRDMQGLQYGTFDNSNSDLLPISLRNWLFSNAFEGYNKKFLILKLFLY